MRATGWSGRPPNRRKVIMQELPDLPLDLPPASEAQPADGVLNYSYAFGEQTRLVPVDSIKTAEPFASLQAINPELVQSIAEQMRQSEFYDPGHPLILGSWGVTGPGGHPTGGEDILLDGHHRLAAARLAGLKEVAVAELYFTDEDDALTYAVRCQTMRRNLDLPGLVRLAAILRTRKATGRPQGGLAQHCAKLSDAPGKAAAELAEKLDISTRKAEQVINIIDHAPAEVKEKIASGEIKTVNAAERATKAASKPPKEPKPPKAAKEQVELAADEVEQVERVFEAATELSLAGLRALAKKLAEYLNAVGG